MGQTQQVGSASAVSQLLPVPDGPVGPGTRSGGGALIDLLDLRPHQNRIRLLGLFDPFKDRRYAHTASGTH